MQIQITITPTNLDEAQSILARIGANAAITVAEAEPAKRTRKAKAEAELIAPEYHVGGQPIAGPGPGEMFAPPPAEQPAPAPAAAPTPAAAPAPVAAAPAIDYKLEIAPMILRASQSAGIPKVQELLKQFGAAKGGDVKPEDLPALRDGLKALLETTEGGSLL